ncbi:hypothetical protein Tco_1338445 [Tanacetum coccineum]
MEDVRYQLNTSSLQERRTGFAAALAVLITGASQSRQHDKSEPSAHSRLLDSAQSVAGVKLGAFEALLLS